MIGAAMALFEAEDVERFMKIKFFESLEEGADFLRAVMRKP